KLRCLGPAAATPPPPATPSAPGSSLKVAAPPASGRIVPRGSPSRPAIVTGAGGVAVPALPRPEVPPSLPHPRPPSPPADMPKRVQLLTAPAPPVTLMMPEPGGPDETCEPPAGAAPV